MRIAAVRPDQLAVVVHENLIPLTNTVPVGSSMIDLITHWDTLRTNIAAAARGSGTKLDPKQLLAPVARPSKIWAAASNYRRGGTGLDNSTGRGAATSASNEEILDMAFLKPPSSVTGPEGNIIIPRTAETIFPELELCAVIGKEVRNVSREAALDAVFGYTVILDVTARSDAWTAGGLVSTRCMRKGFDTFAPIGPWITTRDEIPDPQTLQMRLWVNGELRQSATTGGMINNVATLVSYLSRVSTLYPGDLISTGNPDAPDFQQQLAPGDSLTAEIEKVGKMNLYVQSEK